MKFMNKLIIYVVALMGLLSFQSCDDFLDVEPHGLGSPEIKDELDARAAITGAYDALQDYRYYGRNFVVFGDAMTENVQLSPTNSNRFVTEANWNWTKSDADIRDFWNKSYDEINRVNTLINATNISGDSVKINQMRGEAYALRALAHFDLVRLFAQDYKTAVSGKLLGVPYITKHDPKGKPFRNTVEEVYTNILADLTKASTLVTTSRIREPYTISPAAVNALFAKVYLTMGNYEKAKSYGELVISKYSLIPNADYLASWEKEYTNETIFGISQTPTDYQGTDGLGYIYIEAGYGDLLANPALVKLYGDDDVRKSWFVKGNAESKKNNIYLKNKYPGRSTGTPGLDTYNVLRLSEIYLVVAEAASRTGDEATAKKYLDAIKQRAQPSAVSTTDSGEKLIDAILLEKRKELAFEGSYFYDLKRLQKPIIGALIGSTSATMAYPDYRRAWPIPERETDANPNIATQQNPEY